MSTELAPKTLARDTQDESERSLDEAPCWPVTGMVATALTLLLGVSVAALAALGPTSTAQWLTLALPMVLAAMAARALFEVLSFAAPRPGLRGYAAASLPPTLVALALMASACWIVGVHWSVAACALSAALMLLTLAAAVTMRAVEVRMRLGLRRVYFVGSETARGDLERELRRRTDANLVGATVAFAPTPRARERLVDAVLAAKTTVLVLDDGAIRRPALVAAAAELNQAGVRVRDFVSYYEYEFKKVPLGELSPSWFLFDIASIHRRGVYLVLGRTLEGALAAVLLVLTTPLLVVLMALIKLTSRGPALYRQERVGKDGVPFTLLKLRTMACTTAHEAAWASSQRELVTAPGHLLRRFHLDELPQLWNVLRGDLAMVGPRPEQVPIVRRLDEEIPYYSARHCVRPGLTGWAQVNLGYSGSNEGAVAKLQRDLYYVKHHSVRLDALIIWLTLRAVLAGRG
jgi:lipopolysaccharide/colanic/teichoic acid biosynthesis glycosyltransferase